MDKMVNFYQGKKVFITGHTGFKGSWLCHVLKCFGAEIKGYSLEANTVPNLFNLSGLDKDSSINTVYADIRNLALLKKELNSFNPEIVIHMAAQPIVRASYDDPVYTYETNVMGTVNILEAVRGCKSVKSFLNVTTDKVYENKEWEWGYRENEPLDGYDPYSNSKSCSELVTHSYNNSFFKDTDTAVSTARAGNVIGGGDFAEDRIIPDCIRAVKNSETIIIRNPHSTRPYQHVLEPLFAYLLIAKEQFINKEVAGWYNVGPEEADCVNTGNLANLFCQYWGEDATWIDKYVGGPHEANFLKLDCSKLKKTFNWKPVWHIDEAISNTVYWSKAWINDENLVNVMENQIKSFLKCRKR